MPRPRHVTVLLLALAVMSGCADDSAPARARDGRVNVTLDDFSITPQRIRAAPGRIEFRAVNHGAIGHTLRVKRGDQELVAIKTLRPGESGSSAGRLGRGTYDLVCILGNHQELGMYGTLTVR